MKKIISTLSLLITLAIIVSVPAHAETTICKSHSEPIYYGGQKGDFALSFNALPLINFVGNMFNGTVSQSFTGLNSVNPSIFSGSMLSGFFSSDKITFSVGAGFNNSNNKAYTYNEDYTIQESVKTTGNKELMLMVGSHYLIRPGKRLQPILGANFIYAYSNKNFEQNDDRDEVEERYNKDYPSNTLGLIANLGVEFFFNKSISLSSFLDLGITQTTSNVKFHNSKDDYTYIKSKQSKFSTGKMGGNLALNFYF